MKVGDPNVVLYVRVSSVKLQSVPCHFALLAPKKQIPELHTEVGSFFWRGSAFYRGVSRVSVGGQQTGGQSFVVGQSSRSGMSAPCQITFTYYSVLSSPALKINPGTDPCVGDAFSYLILSC